MCLSRRYRRTIEQGDQHGDSDDDRVDRADVEPDHRMHQDLSRMQELLRRRHGQATACHGRTWL